MIRIAHSLLPNASAYERKSQRLDQAALGSNFEVTVVDPREVRNTVADVVHFYGNDLAASDVTGLSVPYVASVDPHIRRLSLRKPPRPRYVLSPVAPIDPEAHVQNLPEAVEDIYFAPASPSPAAAGGAKRRVRVIGTYVRPSLRNMIDQTLVRLSRTRADIEWIVFDHAPTPADLHTVDIWVDPAIAENDFDGFVAEAIAAGTAVVASRTAINSQRLEKGRTGFLVPPRDANELTHAILAALFKSEVAELKIEAGRQTAGKFRPRQRVRVLERIYETLVP